MRVTNGLMINSQIKNMNASLDRLYTLQQKIASGKEYLSASENPAVCITGFALRSSLKELKSYQETAVSTRDWITASEFSLSKLSEINIRAISLVTSGLNDTFGTDERNIMAEELDGMINQAVALGNTQHLNKFIFSGTSTRTMPFEIDTSGPVDTLVYNGNAGVIRRDIAPGEKMRVNTEATPVFSPIIAAMIEARDALRAGDMVALRTSLDNVQDAHDVITTAVTDSGTRLRNIESTIERMAASVVEIEALVTQTEDIKMTDAISKLRNQETIYQAVLQVGSRANAMLNLFDVLR